MKKSIYLLFLLLIACAPVATANPTLTAVPPTATATLTPTPTETPEPTATPAGFQVSGDGSIQFFENGRWTKIEVPQGIWGPVDGVKVVLEKDENGNEKVLTQMQLINGFIDADGDDIVNVSEFNKETKQWDLPFSVTRISPMTNSELYARNTNFKRGATQMKGIDGINSMTSVLGLRTVEDAEGKNSLEFMVLYKNHIVRVGPTQIRFVDPNRGFESFVQKDLDVVSALETISRVDIFNKSVSWLDYFILQNGATTENCNSTLTTFFKPGNGFSDWCNEELNKGANQKKPNKDNVDWIFQNTPDSVFIDENFDLDNLKNIWEEVGQVDEILGAYFELGLVGKR